MSSTSVSAAPAHAHIDRLTGLLTREAITATIGRVTAQRQYRAGLLFIDLDRFKQVNDTHGHDVGDELLRQVAERLRGALPPHSHVGRLGGDEFLAIVQIDSSTDLQDLGDRLVVSLSSAYRGLPADARVGASIGVSIYPDHGVMSSDLTRCADLAMYEAKRRGRGCCVQFTQPMLEQANRRRLIDIELRHAIQTNGFSIAWQPRFHLQGPQAGQIAGVETLFRLPDVISKVCTVSEAIEMAERSGLISDLGLVFSSRVMACMKEHPALRQRPVGINFSLTQIGDDRIIERLLEWVSILGRGIIEVELTESALLRDAGRLIPRLNALRLGGVRVALDDFGAGYSHFGHLMQLPVDVIKVDQSLIRPLESSAKCRTILSSLRSLASGLGVEIVAEGVETTAQAEFLAHAGYDFAQGYLFAHPTTLSNLLRMTGMDCLQ